MAADGTRANRARFAALAMTAVCHREERSDEAISTLAVRGTEEFSPARLGASPVAVGIAVAPRWRRRRALRPASPSRCATGSIPEAAMFATARFHRCTVRSLALAAALLLPLAAMPLFAEEGP